MPRRSSRQTTQASSSTAPSEGRRTRGAIKAVATEEPEPETPSRSRSRKGAGGDTSPAPKKSRGQSASPAPPVSRGRRGRTKTENKEEEAPSPAKTERRTSGRARKPVVVQEVEPDEEEEEEEEDQDEDVESEPEEDDDEEYEEKPKSKKKAAKSPAKGKGRGRGRPPKKASPPKGKRGRPKGKKKQKDSEDEEEDEDWEAEMAKDLGEDEGKQDAEEEEAAEEEPAEETTRSGRRTRRSTRGNPKKTQAAEPPRSARKSPRGASRKASEAIEAIAKSEEVEGTPEPEEGAPKDKEETDETDKPMKEEENEAEEAAKVEKERKEEKQKEEPLSDSKSEVEPSSDTTKDVKENVTEEKSQSQEEKMVVEEEEKQMENEEEDLADSASAESEEDPDKSAVSMESEGKKRKREEDESEVDAAKKVKIDKAPCETAKETVQDTEEGEQMETEGSENDVPSQDPEPVAPTEPEAAESIKPKSVVPESAQAAEPQLPVPADNEPGSASEEAVETPTPMEEASVDTSKEGPKIEEEEEEEEQMATDESVKATDNVQETEKVSPTEPEVTEDSKAESDITGSSQPGASSAETEVPPQPDATCTDSEVPSQTGPTSTEDEDPPSTDKEPESVHQLVEPTLQASQATVVGMSEGSIPPQYRAELEAAEKVDPPIQPVQATPVGLIEGSIPPQYKAELLVQESSASDVAEEMQVDPDTHDQSAAQNMRAESAAQSGSTDSKVQGEGTDLSDFVVVGMDDVPRADSAEISEALPQHRESIGSSSEQSEESSTTAQAASESRPVIPQLHSSVSQNGEEQAAPVINSNDTATSPTTPSVDPLLSRRLAPNPGFTNFLQAHTGFTIATYNILADCHVKRADYSFVPSEYLNMTYRHKRLLQEFKYLNPDILCLQEVDPDYYTATLKPAMDLLGYNSVYHKRADDFHHEGEATFYKASRFSLVHHSGSKLTDLACKELEGSGFEDSMKQKISTFLESAAVVLFTKFQCLRTQRTMTVANIHVDYANFSNNSLQCVQIASAIKELVTSAEGPSCPHLIVGDFNCWPGSPGYQLAKEGYLDDQSMATLQQQECVPMPDGQVAPLVNLWWKGFQHTSGSLKSAYDTVFGMEPITCQWLDHINQDKYVGSEPATSVVCGLQSTAKPLDYIWFSADTLDVANVFETPKEEVLRKPTGGIPSIHFPSDHLSLKAQLTFK